MTNIKKPPDRSNSKIFKCHPKNCVVHIICEEVYHLSDFNRPNNIKLLSNIFAVCHKHQNITSQITENTFLYPKYEVSHN